VMLAVGADEIAPGVEFPVIGRVDQELVQVLAGPGGLSFPGGIPLFIQQFGQFLAGNILTVESMEYKIKYGFGLGIELVLEAFGVVAVAEYRLARLDAVLDLEVVGAADALAQAVGLPLGQYALEHEVRLSMPIHLKPSFSK